MYLQFSQNSKFNFTTMQWYLKSNCFHLFLGELKSPKRHFEINWPLSLLQNIRLKQNAKKCVWSKSARTDSMKKCAQGCQKTNENKIFQEFSECKYINKMKRISESCLFNSRRKHFSWHSLVATLVRISNSDWTWSQSIDSRNLIKWFNEALSRS